MLKESNKEILLKSHIRIDVITALKELIKQQIIQITSKIDK